MSTSFQDYQIQVERTLKHSLELDDAPSTLIESMRYATLNGGKRIRALLVYSAGEIASAPLPRLHRVAAAIECIHAYSLIHDDLPAMDDDDLRRGKPSTHKAFDEATAILAGDALQALAFELINHPESELSAEQARKISYLFAQAAGKSGMVAGQVLDIQATGAELNLNELEQVHKLKTGALIQAAILSGYYCSDARDQETELRLAQFGDFIGLAFQVIDDVLDVESSTQELGKSQGSDMALGKSTYPSLLGLRESKALSESLYQQAMDCLTSIGDNTDNLSKLARMIVHRSK